MAQSGESPSNTPVDRNKTRLPETRSSSTVIVYNCHEGKLYLMPENAVTGYHKAIMPGKRTKGDIYLELQNRRDTKSIDQKETAQAWLATVDLGRLGWMARWKRHMGEIKYVYVKRGN